MLSLTRKLLKLRRASQLLSIGNYTAIQGVPDDCFIYMRQSNDQRYLIALNFSSEERQVRLPDMGKGYVRVSTHLDREGMVELGDFALRGDEGCVVEVANTI